MSLGPRTIAALLLVPLGLAGCDQPQAKEAGKAAAAKPAPPAKVEKLPGEADLTTITLAPEAESRLGIATTPVERKEVRRTRMLGGEVIVPPGRSITVASPLAGTILAPEDGIPAPGTHVRRGQVVCRLMPLLSPEARATIAQTRVDTQGQVDQAEKQLAQAKVQLDRAERLHRDRLGSAGAVVDAQAQYDVAEAGLRAAKARRDALDKTIKGAEGGTLDPLPIEVEADGVLKNVHAMAGQKVAAGAMLFDVIRLDRVWVRIPVYVGDLDAIAADEPAEVGGLADAPGAPAKAGKPIPAPPSGDPLAATVDLFYEVENAKGDLRPGQRVGVTLPLKGEKTGLAVPRQAVLRDYDGGAWVYESLGKHKYARRRVRLDRVVGPLAVLAAGPAPGTKVVADGAAELFGIEFGGAK
jgi:membrane fusion protein, heavy metal efflux system